MNSKLHPLTSRLNEVLGTFSQSMSRNAPEFNFTLTVNAADLNRAQKTLDAILDPRNLKGIVDQFLAKDLLPALEKRFHSGQADLEQHLPMYYSRSKKRVMPITGRVIRGSQTQLGNDKKGNSRLDNLSRKQESQAGTVVDMTDKYRQGLRDLFRAISARSDEVRGSTEVVAMGSMHRILSMDTSTYSLLAPRPSDFSSWFYTVEFGTGVAENVGGSQWVNHEGESKNADGSWMYGKAPGLHIYGQKGFHFLFDEGHAPDKYYISLVNTWLPERVRDYFKSYGLLGR